MVHPSDNSTTSLNRLADRGAADDSVVIAQRCEEYGQLRHTGAVVSTSEFAARYPEVQTQLLNALNALELLGSFQPKDTHGDSRPAPAAIAGCKVVREIGRGGMGIVYEARHPTVSRRLAIKLLINRRGLRKSFRGRFRREAEAASRLTHPNIIPFIDCGEHEGTPYISMLFVEGESLDHLLDRHWDNQRDSLENSQQQLVGVDFQTIAKIGAGAASALAHAHLKGAIHRDIKPANLILDSQNKVWVADFGLAKLRDEDDDLSRTGDMIGTPRYMAPEQIRGVADERSDIYSLGITLWELATGCRAWDSADGGAMIAAKSAMQLPSIREVHPDVPISLARIIDRCCSPKPRKRFQTAEQLRSALSEFAEGTITEAADVSPSRAAVTMACLVACMLFPVLATRGFLTAENSAINADAASSVVPAPVSFAAEITQISMSEGGISIPDLRLTANNPDGKPFYWQLADTMDAEHFLVQQLSGTVCFVNSPSVDLPLDKDADNVYELEFIATQSLAPSIRIVVENQSELQLLDPVSRTTASLQLPGNLLAITAIDQSRFLHTHAGNDGSIALFRTNSHTNPSSSMLLNSKCEISPFIRDLAAAGNDEFVALEKSKDGFGLRQLTLNSTNEFQEGGLIRKFDFAENPVGIALLSDSDLLVLDRASDGTSLRLFEAAISGETIVSCQELPTGWTCDSRIHGIVSWLGPVSTTSTAQVRRLVQIKVEAATGDSTLR